MRHKIEGKGYIGYNILSNISRVLYFFQVGDKAFLTNGFVKKTQKTPRQEIELAKKYRADYMRRHPNDQV